MPDFLNKEIIAFPDTSPQSGLGHILRTIKLLNRLHLNNNVHLILGHSSLADLCCDSLVNIYPSICLLPEGIFLSDILLLFDSYNCHECSSLYQAIALRASSPKLKVLSICDTLDQAKDMLSLVPSTDLLFPNIITSSLQSALYRLSEVYGCSVYHGYPYILLDEYITNTPAVAPIRVVGDFSPPTCLVSFGFSSSVFTPELLVHCKDFLNCMIRRFASIEFCLLGPNSLQLFIELGLTQYISQYHRYLAKHSLVRMYDSCSFYFGSLGYSIWERAFRLLPSFVYPIADNQAPYVEVGLDLNILYPSSDAIELDFDFPAAMCSMRQGALCFKESILKYHILL